MKARLFVLGLVLAASTAFAQPAYVDHRTYPADFASISPGAAVADRPGYVWRHDGKGWYFELANTSPIPTVPTPDPDCADVDPYRDTALAVECALRHTPPRPPLPVYIVGQQYTNAYPSTRMLVLAVSRTLEGVEVITFQWLTDFPPDRQKGDVAACRNATTGSSTCGVWMPVTP